tara:strand:- start:3806 stop:4045 length:240 start_codon:yes stop_codon:yes gene_type:complete
MKMGRPSNNEMPEMFTDEAYLACHLYQKGMSIKDISEKYDCTSYMVTQFLLWNDIKLRKRGRVSGVYNKFKHMENKYGS